MTVVHPYEGVRCLPACTVKTGATPGHNCAADPDQRGCRPAGSRQPPAGTGDRLCAGAADGSGAPRQRGEGSILWHVPADAGLQLHAEQAREPGYDRGR